jgi:hypothetical protein
VQELGNAHTTIQDGVADVQGRIADIEQQTLGRIAEYEDEYLPMVYTYDKW